MPGTLFVVATPIGNLEDLTFRALRVLREVDLIAAEDTRRTAKLLAHYEIRRPLVSVREQNEARMGARLVDRLAAGENVALVSDAGTPGISDPGARVVALARDRGITVVPIPGPSAVVTALSVAGLEFDQFVFAGFPPAAGAARERWMQGVAADPRVTVLYESPHRIGRTVGDLTELLAGRQIFVFRELTKIHEQLVTTHNVDTSGLSRLGEFTLVVAPAVAEDRPDSNGEQQVIDLAERLAHGLDFGSPEMVKLLAMSVHAPERVISKVLKKHKISIKQQKHVGPDADD